MKEMLRILKNQGICPIKGVPLVGNEVVRFKALSGKTIFMSKVAVEEAAKKIGAKSSWKMTSIMEQNIGIVGTWNYREIPDNLAAQLWLDSGKRIPELIHRKRKKRG